MPDDEIEMQCERCGQAVTEDDDGCIDCQMQEQDDETSSR